MKVEVKTLVKGFIALYIIIGTPILFTNYLSSKTFEPVLFNIADRDTYADSDNPNVNYDNEIWTSAGSIFASQYYEAYYHFILSNRPVNYEKIELSLSVVGEMSYAEYSIILVDNSWQENTLTWNNKPTHQQIIKNVTFSTEVYKIDLTDFLRNRDEVSICINITNSTIVESISFYTREDYVYDTDAPMLIWTYNSGFTSPVLIVIALIYALVMMSLSVLITKITKARVLKKNPIT